MAASHPFDDGWFTTTIVSLVYPLGPAAIILMPMILGGLVDGYGYTEQQAANIAAAEGMGLVVASLAASLWIRHVSWVRALLAGCLAYAVLNVASANLEAYGPLLAMRFVTGLAGGCVFAVAVAALGDNRQPDRAFGLAQAVQGVVMLVLFFLSPYLLEAAGVGALYGMLAVVALLTLLALGWYPSSGSPRSHGGAAPLATSHTRLITLGLVASIVYFVNVFGLWAFIERIGQGAGLEPATIGLALGLSQVVAIGGALAATWAGDRFGRYRPLLIVLVGQCAAIYALLGAFGAPLYFVVTGVFQALFIVAVSYQMGAIAKLDVQGRWLVMMTGAQGFGSALGPVAAATLIGEGGDYQGVLYLAAACCVVGTLAFLWIIRSSRL